MAHRPPGCRRRWRPVIVFATLLALCLYRPSTAHAAEGLVFLPHLSSSEPVATALTTDPALATIRFTLVERQRDLAAALNIPNAIDVIICAPDLGVLLPGFQPVWQFTSNGIAAVPLVIVSTDPRCTSATTAQGVVAIVDELGKKGSEDWLARILPTGLRFEKVRRGKDPDDLFRMMGLEIVQYCLLEEHALSRLRADFKGHIERIATTRPVRRPAIFIRQGSDRGPLAGLGRMASATLSRLAVDGIIPWNGEPGTKGVEP